MFRIRIRPRDPMMKLSRLDMLKEPSWPCLKSAVECITETKLSFFATSSLGRRADPSEPSRDP